MDISFDTDFAGYPTIAEALGKPLEIGTIPLSQLTARIELAEFNVSGFQGASVKEKVTVTGVDLLNLNPESYTINEQTHKNALICLRVKRVMWRSIMGYRIFRQLILL